MRTNWLQVVKSSKGWIGGPPTSRLAWERSYMTKAQAEVKEGWERKVWVIRERSFAAGMQREASQSSM